MRERGTGVQQGKYSHPLWCALHSGIFHSSSLQSGFPPGANTIEQKFDKHRRLTRECKSVYIMRRSLYVTAAETFPVFFFFFVDSQTKANRTSEFIQQLTDDPDKFVKRKHSRLITQSFHTSGLILLLATRCYF